MGLAENTIVKARFSGAALAASRCLSGGLVKTNRSFCIGAMKLTFYRTALLRQGLLIVNLGASCFQCGFILGVE